MNDGFDTDQATRLIAAARDAARHAHAPYSRFAVGAAVLLDDGSVITGANFENASYGLSLCAETVALATASAQGRLRDVVAIGVIGGAMDSEGRATGNAPVSPCGRCRHELRCLFVHDATTSQFTGPSIPSMRRKSLARHIRHGRAV